MNIDDVILESIIKPLEENDYYIITKEYCRIGNKNIVKRISKLIWKNSPIKEEVIDFRKYNIKRNRMMNGISVEKNEVYKILEAIFQFQEETT
ncbi:hypothetical protein [Haploplasma modicum]|uniref:hypothetical protein n=1 Tax=Haploplasma modicum TaxID=2150 RepID=UPI00138AD7E0|nr:hypothetical protein [Haploplasma modicum]